MNEIFIRQKLQQFLENKHRKDDAVFIHELRIDGASRRADLVMANGHLSGFEIKSELDNLDRLPGQLEAYSRLFEQVIVVSVSKHINKIKKITPNHVGIWEYRDGKFIIIKKPGKFNKLSVESWLSHLSVNDLRKILKQENLKISGSRSEVIERLHSVKCKKLRSYTLELLKERFSSLLEERLKQAELVKEVNTKQQESFHYSHINFGLTTVAIPQKLS